MLDQSFTDFSGPTFSFDLDIGLYEIQFSSSGGVGTLFLEAQTFAGPFVGSRCLNTFSLAGSLCVTIGTPGIYRFNCTAGSATVSITGP